MIFATTKSSSIGVWNSSSFICCISRKIVLLFFEPFFLPRFDFVFVDREPLDLLICYDSLFMQRDYIIWPIIGQVILIIVSHRSPIFNIAIFNSTECSIVLSDSHPCSYVGMFQNTIVFALLCGYHIFLIYHKIHRIRRRTNGILADRHVWNEIETVDTIDTFCNRF